MFRMERNNRRVSVNTRLKMHLPAGLYETRVLNMSMGGLLVESQDLINVDEVIFMEIVFPDGKIAECEGKIIHNLPETIHTDNYLLRIQFSKIDEKNVEILRNAIEKYEKARNKFLNFFHA